MTCKSTDKILLVFLFLFSAPISQSTAQEIDDNDLKKLIILDQNFSAHHVDYQSIRPQLRERIVIEFADQLDPEALLLTNKDLDQLTDELPEINRETSLRLKIYLNNTVSIMQDKTVWLSRMLNSIKDQDFFQPDSIFIKAQLDTLEFAADTVELSDKWLKYLKLRTLQKTVRDTLMHTYSQSEINKRLNVDLQKIIKEEQCRLESQSSNLAETILTGFLRAYAKSFDPHSDYFSTSSQERFLTSLSNEMYSTGLIFELNGSKFVIREIVPFSDASNYESIKPGDEIISVQNNGEWVSLHCLSGNEINAIFYGHSINFLNLEIRSSTDQIHRNFKLEKNVVANISNHIYKFLLKTEEMDIGYVRLPSFYSDIVSGTGSVGQDLAVLLLDLNSRELDGLIIDLRNNGGGSMQEAIDLSGFFADYGPLFMTTSKISSKGFLHKDTRRGRIYKGKVVFMVNTFSASASELVVSALRHYPEQLIVGSPTFGKSTSQSLIPLFHANQQKHFGMAKITTSRMYNIKGASYQGAGVQPDIELPSFPTKKLTGESSYRYSLKNRPIAKSFKSIAPREVPIDDIRKSYRSRLVSNTTIRNLKYKYDSLESVYEQGTYFSLSFEQFNNFKPSELIIEENTVFEIETIEEDVTFRRISKLLEENAAKDPILNEVFRIFGDWIKYDQD